jgi:hypothetical protein
MLIYYLDEKLLLRSIDAAPVSSLVDLSDALSANSECLRELRDQAVAVISRSLALLLDAIVDEAIDDEPSLLSREYLFFLESYPIVFHRFVDWHRRSVNVALI